MMGAYFTGYRDSFFFCQTQHHFTVFCGTMTKMQVASGIFCDQNISCYNSIFHCVTNSRQTKLLGIGIFIHTASVYHMNIFTMCQYRNIHACCNLHRFFINLRIHNRFPILTDRRRTRPNHTFNIRKLLTFHPLSDSSCLQDIDQITLHCFIFYIRKSFRIINDRFCVWHGNQCGNTTPCRSLRSGKYILFMCQPRITQMYMHINQPRHDVAASGINHLVRFILDVFFYFLDLIIFQQYICNLIQLCIRIDHMTIFYQDFHIASFPEASASFAYLHTFFRSLSL